MKRLALVALSAALLSYSCVAKSQAPFWQTPSGVSVRKHGFRSSDDGSGLSSSKCNIDRNPGISSADFEAQYKGKRPVILGSPSRSLNLSVDVDLAQWLQRVGDTPWVTFSPVQRPDVGGHISTLAEHLATFTTLEERQQALNAARDSPSSSGALLRALDGSAAAGGFHVSTLSLEQHPQLAMQLLRHRYRGVNASLDTLLQLAADSTSEAATATAQAKGYPTVPSLTNSDLCTAYGTPGPFDCQCAVTLFVLGQSGAGLPFHWHNSVVGNEMLVGRKRWFLSRHVPPGGFNHRQTMDKWLQEVYPTLPASVFKPSAKAGDGGGSGEPALYECTLGPGEVMYAPDGWYHATVDVGHAININYRCNVNEADEEWAQVSNALVDMSEIDLPGWKAPALPLDASMAGVRGDANRVRALRQLYDEDPTSHHLLGKAETPVNHSLALAVSGRGKAAIQEALPGGENFLSLSATSTPEAVPEIARLAELAVVLFPDEPDFLFFTSKLMIKAARDWVLENVIKPDQKRAREAKQRAAAGNTEPDNDAIRGPKPIGDVDDWTGLIDAPSSRMASTAVQRLEYAIRVNPLAPDYYAFLSVGLSMTVGEVGWPISPPEAVVAKAKRDKTTKPRSVPYTHSAVGQHLLDVALAAARRALRLEPTSASVCNIAATLLSNGAVDRYYYNSTGGLRYRRAAHLASRIALPGSKVNASSTAASKDSSSASSSSDVVPVPGPLDLDEIRAYLRKTPKYQEAWNKVRGASHADVARTLRFTHQLQRCVGIANTGLTVADNQDAIESLYSELSNSVTALSRLIPYRASQHSWFDMRHVAAMEQATVLEALRRNVPVSQLNSVDISAGGAVTEDKTKPSGAASAELTLEKDDDIVPLYLPPLRQSAMGRYEGLLHETSANSDQFRGKPLPVGSAYQVISAAYRKAQEQKDEASGSAAAATPVPPPSM